MKKLSIILSFLFVATLAFAQQNLRDGYVITLEGDTLHGVIDFRTSAMNTKRCVFKQDGATEFKTYLPGEIDGYRFTNNGVYYITKNVTNEAGTREMVFAEYILRGNMSLYQVGADEMLLVDEDGNEASFSLDKAKNATNADELRAEIGDAWRMLGKSEKAGNMIWKLSKNRDNTKKAVMTYIDDFCTDGYCEVFEYQSEVTPKEYKMIHPWVKVGAKMTRYKFWECSSFSGLAPQVSAGVDFHFNRILKGLMFNAGLTYELGKASRDAKQFFQGEPSVALNGSYEVEVKYNQFDIMVGPGYQFQTGALKTGIRCGYIFRLASRNFNYTTASYHYRGSGYENEIRMTDKELQFESGRQFGLYAGVGVEYPMKGFALVCNLDYIYDSNGGPSVYNGPVKKNFNQDVTQHGFCLSAGVKF